MAIEHIIINGKSYAVASDVMGVTLGLLEAYNNDVPKVFGAKEWAMLLFFSIFWGEHLEGRESDFKLESLCTVSAEEGRRIIDDFQKIYVKQNKLEDKVSEQDKKKVAKPSLFKRRTKSED